MQGRWKSGRCGWVFGESRDRCSRRHIVTALTRQELCDGRRGSQSGSALQHCRPVWLRTRTTTVAGRHKAMCAAGDLVRCCLWSALARPTYHSNQFNEGSAVALPALSGWQPSRRPHPRIGRQTCHDTGQSRTTQYTFGHSCPLHVSNNGVLGSILKAAHPSQSA